VTVLVVNGERTDVADGTTVTALLERLAVPAEGRGVAVAVDAEVVPRGEWPGHVLPDGAQVEVVTAVQGG
jgi:sulfur carrier protein